MNNLRLYFDFARIGRLFKMDFIKNWKDILIILSAICGFFLITFMISAKTGGIDDSIHSVYFTGLLLLGLILTGSSFKVAHRKLLNHDWLMLPASTFEKFLEKLLLYTIGYSIVALIFYFLFSLLSYFIVNIILDSYFPLFSPINLDILKMAGYYCLIQSVFLLGAVWFKSKNFIKTVLSIVLIWFIIGIVTMIAGLIIFKTDFWVMANSNDFESMNFYGDINSKNLASFFNIFTLVMKIFFYGLMAPVCWFGSWLKLKEIEVKDGI